jgi:hypothetical protein
MVCTMLLNRRRAKPNASPNLKQRYAPNFMPIVEKEMNKKGDFLVDFEEKVFPDVKAAPGGKGARDVSHRCL